MDLKEILTPGRTRCQLNATSQKKALQEVASIISGEYPHLLEADLFEQLIAREKKGSTAIGHGIAIPHCRLKKCDHVVGGLFHLQDYIDFNAFDGQPVNILFVLIVPEDETTLHLEILSLLARKFDSEDFRKELLAASTDQDLYQKAIG